MSEQPDKSGASSSGQPADATPEASDAPPTYETPAPYGSVPPPLPYGTPEPPGAAPAYGTPPVYGATPDPYAAPQPPGPPDPYATPQPPGPPDPYATPQPGGTPDPYAPPAYGPPEYGAPPAYGPAPGHTPPPYGPPAYGTGPAYGNPPPPMPYGSPWMPLRSPEAASTRTQAITAMVINIVVGLFCCNPLSIAGAITAGIGIGKVDSDVRAAKKLVAWGWGLLAAAIVLGIAFWVVLFVIGALSDSGTTDGSTL